MLCVFSSTEISVIPSRGVTSLSKGDETFFSFLLLNISENHSIQGTIRELSDDSQTPTESHVDIARAPIGTFPGYSSTEERGYALVQSFDTTPTGENTLELFFRVRGNETDRVRVTEFLIHYIDTGTKTEQGFELDEKYRIIWEEASTMSPTPTSSSNQTGPIQCATVSSGEGVSYSVACVTIPLIALLCNWISRTV